MLGTVNPILSPTTISQTAEAVLSSRNKGTFYFILSLLSVFLTLGLLLFFVYATFRGIKPSPPPPPPPPPPPEYLFLGFLAPRDIPQGISAVNWETYSSPLYHPREERVIIPREGVLTVSFSFNLQGEGARVFLSVGTTTIPYVNTLNATIEIPVIKGTAVSFHLVSPQGAVIYNEGTYATLTLR